MSRPRVIYVAGAAYSGSTVLGALLGMHPRVICLGEVAMWLRRWPDPERRCGCGEGAWSCPFWVEVLDRVPLTRQEAFMRRVARMARQGERLHAWPLWRFALWRGEERGDYARLNAALYAAAWRIAEVEYVVDTSKAAVRAYALMKSGLIDLRVVHLSRHPLSFAASWIRYHVGQEVPAGPAGFAAGIRAGLTWALQNLAAAALARRAGAASLHVRHEDLIADPQGALIGLGRLLNLDYQEVARRVAQGGPLSFAHMVGGNRVRLKGQVAWSPDRHAHERLSAAARRGVLWMAGPWMRRFGYSEAMP